MKKVLVIILFFAFNILCFSLFVLAVDRVEINTASLEQLDNITGIGPALGQRIIDARPFSSIDDLIKVKGIGEKTLQKIKDQGLAYVVAQGSLSPTTKETTQPVIETATEPITAINEPIKEAPPAYPAGIVFNEILPSPEGADETEEWIEIFNQNNFEVDLSEWKIQDTKGSATTYIFPKNTKIYDYGYLVLKRPETKIILNNTEDGLNLLNPNQKIVDSLNYNTAPRGQSYNKIGNSWAWSSLLTPGLLNNISENQDLLAVKNLPNSKKSDIKEIGAGVAAANLVKSSKMALPSLDRGANPWFLFLTALIITIISAIIILILKIRFKKPIT